MSFGARTPLSLTFPPILRKGISTPNYWCTIDDHDFYKRNLGILAAILIIVDVVSLASRLTRMD